MRLHICHKHLLSIVFASAAFFTFQWLWLPLTPERREEGTRHSSRLILQTWLRKRMLRCHLTTFETFLTVTKNGRFWVWPPTRGASRSFSCYGKSVVRSYDKDEGDSLQWAACLTLCERVRSPDHIHKNIKSDRLKETWISISASGLWEHDM